MTQIEIKLTNVKHYERMSEETNCFDAYILINGIKAAYAKNDGQGGCTNIHVTDIKYKQLLNDAEQYCLSLPAEVCRLSDTETFDIPMNLENYVDNLLDKYLQEKENKRYANKLEKDCLDSICFGTATAYKRLKFSKPLAAILLNPNNLIPMKEKYKEVTRNLKAGERILNTNLSLFDGIVCTNQIGLNSKVKYSKPMADEVNTTYTVIEIEEKTNWCRIRANVDMNIKPTYTANISDLIIA